MLTEADAPADLPAVKRRSPRSEDQPSPRCMLRDAREGAALFGPIYWLFALPQLTVNLAGWAIRELSQRPSWFWGTAIVVTLVIVFAH